MSENVLNNINIDIHYYNHRICTPDWVIVPRITPFINFTYVVSGQGEFIVNDVRYAVKGGDLICVQKGSKESANVNPNDLMDCYCVNVFAKDTAGNDVDFPFQTVTHIGIHEDLIALFQNLTAVWMLHEPCYRLKARAIFMLILAKCYQLVFCSSQKNNGSASNRKRIEMVMQYILSHYNEPISIKEMAKMTKLSPLYFGKLFKQETGKTFREYLNVIRVNQAENLLNSGLYTVSEAAVHCGFSDVFYFSKVFKKYRGISPSEILKRKIS